MSNGWIGLAAPESEIIWELMAWSKPRYSKRRVDLAGKLLLRQPTHLGLESDDQFAALEIINNWRSSHSYPLYAIRERLERRAKKINPEAIVAQRLKRLSSIEQKLQNNAYRRMSLTQIQDIGGCRAIMPSIGEALALAERYGRAPFMKSELHREPTNYIAHPKADGYRSVHLVYKYRTDSPHYKAFDGHKIEIQIRSALQHAWATAAEMLLTFTTIPIRESSSAFLNMHPRSPSVIFDWQEFFKLMATGIAILEDQPVVPGTPSERTEIIDRLTELAGQLNVEAVFSAWRRVSEWRMSTSDPLPGIVTGLNQFEQFLLELEPEQKQLKITPFLQNSFELAFKEYMDRERAQLNNPNTNVVLVSADSIDALRAAYPNYYGDTTVFLDTMKKVISA